MNGLPLGIIELKNPVDEDATIWTAWQQLQTYKAELPTLFAMNAALMVSDGMEARVGTLTAGREWFKPWRTISGEDLADPNMPELQVMLEGVCDVGRFLSLVRDFIVFEDDGSGALAKKMAGYHQFHAVRVAVGETRRAVELQHAGRGGAEGGGRYESGQQPGGLVVDYLGLAHELKYALATYTESGGTGKTALDQEEAVVVLREKYEICCGLFYGFDWSKWVTGTPQEKLGLLPAAQEHILAQRDGKDRCLQAVRELSQAFALAVPHEETRRIRDDVAFFQAVRSVLGKRAPVDARPQEELDLAVRQIVSRAVASDEVTDIFAAAGLDKPDISVLSDEFLAEVRGMPQRNLAVELLQKLLKGEISSRIGMGFRIGGWILTGT